MPSLTAQATFYPNPKRGNSLGIEKCFTLIQDKRIIYFNLYSHKSYLLWAIKWNNLASSQSDFYFYSVREKNRIRGAFLQYLSSLAKPFFYSIIYKLALHDILEYSSCKEVSMRYDLYLATRRAKESIPFSIFLEVDSALDFEKFFGPRISLCFIPVFAQSGLTFLAHLSLLRQMSSIGYYLYFYSELLRPHFSYRKIYTINWP